MKTFAAAVALAALSLAVQGRPRPSMERSVENLKKDEATQSYVTTVDVAVLGGGSAGAYGAVALKAAGKSVAVIEKANRLGGRFDTYADPATGQTVDYGVEIVQNTTTVRNFFAKFGIPITDFVLPPVQRVAVDFTSGQNVSVDLNPDLSAYNAQVDQYPSAGTGINLPNPTPADFSLPFSQFVTKYGLQDVVYSISVTPACSGLGNILNQPTLVIFRCLNPVTESEVSPGGSIVTPNHNFGALYQQVQSYLGSSVLLSSTVVAALRDNDTGAVLAVNTPQGQRIIRARQVLVAYPQILPNLLPLGLDAQEYDVFSRVKYTTWYTVLAKNTGLPAGNYYLNAGANTEYNLPQLPALYHIAPTNDPGTYNYWYGSDYPVSRTQIEASFNAALAMITGKSQSPQTVAYTDHTPYNLHFNDADIQAGYYAKLEALQGHRATWYTGAILALPSSAIWDITAGIVQQVIQRL